MTACKYWYQNYVIEPKELYREKRDPKKSTTISKLLVESLSMEYNMT